MFLVSNNIVEVSPVLKIFLKSLICMFPNLSDMYVFDLIFDKNVLLYL